MTKLQVINNVTANTSFQAKPIGVQTSTNPSDKTLSTTTKVVIGTALTALAATGIYIATQEFTLQQEERLNLKPQHLH